MKSDKLIIPFVAALAITYALSFFVVNPVRPDLVGFAYAAFAILAFIFFRFSANGDVREISLIFFLVPTFVIYFSPLFNDAFDLPFRHASTPGNVTRAAQLAFVGYLSCIAGHYWARRFNPPPLLTYLKDFDVPLDAMVQGSVLLMGLSVFFIVFSRETTPFRIMLGRVTFIVEQLPMLAIALGGMAFLRGYRNPVFWSILFCVFLPVNIFIIVAKTLFYHLLLLVAPLLTMYMLWRRRIPWLWALLPLVALGPAFKARMTERNKSNWNSQLSAPALIATGFDRIISSWKVDDPRILKNQNRQARERMNSLSLLAHCIRIHEDEEKPHKFLATFWSLPLSPIPRIFFPWKPINDHGTTFGLEYGLLYPGEDFAVVLPLMIESYISGGVIGIILLGFFIGSAYHTCFALFEYGRGPVNLIALMTVIYFIVYVENNITLLFGGAMQATAMWWILDRFLGSRAAARG